MSSRALPHRFRDLPLGIVVIYFWWLSSFHPVDWSLKNRNLRWRLTEFASAGGDLLGSRVCPLRAQEVETRWILSTGGVA